MKSTYSSTNTVDSLPTKRHSQPAQPADKLDISCILWSAFMHPTIRTGSQRQRSSGRRSTNSWSAAIRTRKRSWRKDYARQRRHSKMAVSRHIGCYGTSKGVTDGDVSWTYIGRNLSPMMRYAPALGSHFCHTVRSHRLSFIGHFYQADPGQDHHRALPCPPLLKFGKNTFRVIIM